MSQQIALPEKTLKKQAFFALALLVISAIIFAINTFTLRAKTDAEKLLDTAQFDLPNIILLGSDGVNSVHLKIYGYDRDTTPNINNLAKDALVVENAFPNGGNTGGSTISMLTGKFPTETHLIYPPDILTGNDAYQHLPGMLRQMGYQTVQITAHNYADAYSLNLLDGFDDANFRSEGSTFYLGRNSFLENDSNAYFLGIELNRISERLQHAFYLRTMSNPYKVVTEPTTTISELQRVEGLLAFLDQSDAPVFAHIHMMGTHGSSFNPRQQVFSAGKQQDNLWMTDFYDDAILDFDRYVGDIVEHLAKTGKLENTIIIIYSDHGMKYQTNERVPLIIRFPNGEQAGRLKNNAQNLDISPTILDYLGVPQPEWMSGLSLIQGEPSIERPIFAASVAHELLILDDAFWKIDQNKLTPPFYQLGQVSLIYCNRWYKLYLVNPELFYGDVQGHTAPCVADNLPDPVQAISTILDHLAENGYEVFSFPRDIPINRAIVDAPPVAQWLKKSLPHQHQH
jgi:membrane-anchored protein YejM (alkaline phosphatase superfamily)